MKEKRELFLFGGFRLVIDGEDVRLTSAKERALLAYLAVKSPERQSRSHLASLLWGSHFEEQARLSLRQALTGLRRRLGDGLVIADREAVALSRDALDCDVVRFLLLSADPSREGQLAAVRLFGEFLSGLSVGEEGFREWQRRTRERLTNRQIECLQKLANIALEAGEVAGAISHLGEAVRLDEFREDTHCLLLVALAAAGRRAEALRHAEAVARSLHRELGVGLGRKALDVVARIRQGEFDPDPGLSGPRMPEEAVYASEGFGAGTPSPERDHQTARDLDPRYAVAPAMSEGRLPLVGRDEELRLLMSRWESAKTGEGNVVLLSGPPGIGKSRLIEALRESVRADEPTVLRYYCSPFFLHTALHPILEQLERAADLRRTDAPERKLEKLEALLRQGTDRARRSAALLAPLLAIPTGGRYPPVELTPEARKSLAFDALLEQLAGLASRPILVVLEDAQWVDPSSAELFHRVIDHIQQMPVLVLIAHRPEFRPPWTGCRNVTALSIPNLSQRHAGMLIETVLRGRKLAPEVLEKIIARTEGVPLYAEELTKALLDSDVLTPDGKDFRAGRLLTSVAVSELLNASLQARLEGLPTVREIAQVAATLGRVFPHDLLAATSSQNANTLSHALEQMIRAELIYQRGTSPDALYEFKHDLIRDAIYQSQSRSDRRQIHRRIANTLEARFPDLAATKPELLAHHFRSCGLLSKAFDYAIRAGDAAVARYAPSEARARFQDALDLADSLPPSETASRAQIDAALRLAGVAQNREHYGSDLASLKRARALAEILGDHRSLHQIDYWIGRINYVFGRFDQAIQLAASALASAEDSGNADADTANPVNLLARVHCLRGEPREAITQAKRNITQMQRLGNRLEEASMWGVLAFACALHGEFEEAFAAAARGVDLGREVKHLPTQAACVFFSGVVRGWHGDIDSAEVAFDDALGLCDRTGDVFRKYLAHGWRGQAYLLSGELHAAAADLQCCLELGEQIGTNFHRGAFQAFHARVRLLEGDIDAALRDAMKALKVAGDTAQDWSRSIALSIHAEVLVALEPPMTQAATCEVRSAIASQQSRECRLDLAFAHLIEGHVHAAAGKSQQAIGAYDLAGRMFRDMGVQPGRKAVRQALEALHSGPRRACDERGQFASGNGTRVSD